MRYKGIILHHSASPFDTTPQQIDKWHKERGWKGIGYHFVCWFDIDCGMWRWTPGRKLWEVGAHCRGYNYDHVGVCVTGDYERWAPTQAMLVVLIRGLVMLCAERDIPITELYGHREKADTLCPGKNLFNEIPKIKALVRSIMPVLNVKPDGARN